MLSMRLFCGLSFAFAVAVATGCSSSTTDGTPSSSGGTTEDPSGTNGDGGGGDGSTNGGKTDGGSSTSSNECCLNGKAYDCPDEAALKKCGGAGGSMNECIAKCMGNPQCIQECTKGGPAQPDPSACTRAAGRDSKCASTCEGQQHTETGKSCTNDASCSSSEHCFAGKCYLSSAGAPCSSTAQCGNAAQCNASCCEL